MKAHENSIPEGPIGKKYPNHPYLPLNVDLAYAPVELLAIRRHPITAVHHDC
jgi:hypothetical protein